MPCVSHIGCTLILLSLLREAVRRVMRLTDLEYDVTRACADRHYVAACRKSLCESDIEIDSSVTGIGA